MEIYFNGEEAVRKEILETMEKAAAYCLRRENADTERTELSVSFVNEERIRALNSRYRGVDLVTDVLSFPQFSGPGEFPASGVICLGDVVICKDKAEKQAEEFGHSFEREIIYLFTHSVLHLLGYDHIAEEEKKAMRRREEEVMAHLGMERDVQSGPSERPGGRKENLDKTDQKELYRKAKKAAENAYAPFSGLRVGAALLTKTGEIFTGANVENSSYGGTICAERTACVKAVSEGYRIFEALAVVSAEGAVRPCGICRQFLYEFAPDLTVITGENEDNLEVLTLRELLPGGFRL